MRSAARRDRRQGGFTLIELMVSLVISSLLIAMILSVFVTMSGSYRAQQQIAELQQELQAAASTLETDLHQAGWRVAQGFTWAGGGTVLTPALSITDGGGGAQQPDQIAIFYADRSAESEITDLTLPLAPAAFTSVNVDSVDRFAPGDLVVMVVVDPNSAALNFEAGQRPPEEPDPSDPVASTARIPLDYACVLQVAQVQGAKITFSTNAPWGTATNSHCTYATINASPDLRDSPAVHLNALYTTGLRAMLYKFVARAYRIDPTRKDLSVFQVSPSGGLVPNDWQDLGLGFTNFQIASRWYDQTDVDNADTDTDPWRNWYSGTAQGAKSAASARYNADPNRLVAALQVSVSFVVRTTRPITSGAVTAATPQLQDPTNTQFNDIGDSPSVVLAGVADAARPIELRGNMVYRYATIKVDTRNLGIGR